MTHEECAGDDDAVLLNGEPVRDATDFSIRGGWVRRPSESGGREVTEYGRVTVLTEPIDPPERAVWRILETPILRHLPWMVVRVVRYALPVAVILVALGLLAGLVWVNVWAWGDILNWRQP